MNYVVGKIEKAYANGMFFKAYISEEEIFPFKIKIKKITQKELQENFLNIKKDIQKLKDLGLFLEYKEFDFKTLGRQILPICVKFDDVNAVLKFLKKEKEYKRFVFLYEKTVGMYPSLKELFFKNPFLILKYEVVWERILKVVEFFIKNPNPQIYIREICIKDVDTKFIEKHKKPIDTLLSSILHKKTLSSLSDFAFEKKYGLRYPLAQVRFRILDERLYIAGLSDLSLTCKEFAKLECGCKKVFIVENKITFLSFFDLKDSIVVFGSGYGLSVLKTADWLRDKEIYYWGDIDEDGFAILSQLRGYFKNVKSFLMDEKTIEKFKSLSIEHNLKPKNREVLNLTKEEKLVYDRLRSDFYGKNFRLEQERIPFDYAIITSRGEL